ncbi:MAG TPA: methyltransferase domain-containing protein [Solirubrobacteraceae bacterium]|nr:methyltransferase domain-containing protein [Solirubrobacteraceae bacterium]
MTEYLLSRRRSPDVEQARLRLLEEYHDPLSVSQLDAIGVGKGWRCLDVGAGAGSVTRMLAERVGSTGSVLAVDLDTSLLEGLASDRVKVRRHDLLSDELPQSAFDLVHARLLLMFLSPRLGALERLVSAARPGGWVASIAPDFTTVALSPPSLVWRRVWSRFLDVVMAGGLDPGYGARLCGDLCAVGLVDVHADYIGRRYPGGTLPSRLLSLTLERVREQMVLIGAESREIDEARRLLEDPASTFIPPTTCVARGRRIGRS